MAIKYVLVKKVNPQQNNDKEYYYAKGVNAGHIDADRLAEEIQQRCSLTTGDCKNVWDNMWKIIVEHLNNGQSVELPNIGTIYVTVKSGPIEHLEDDVKGKIRIVGPKLRPCKSFLKAIFARLERVRGDKSKQTHSMLSENERKALALSYLNKHKVITRSKLQKMTHASKTTTINDLNKLVEAGTAIRIKKGPFIKYHLKS